MIAASTTTGATQVALTVSLVLFGLFLAGVLIWWYYHDPYESRRQAWRRGFDAGWYEAMRSRDGSQPNGY
jgi:hypothetical protein